VPSIDSRWLAGQDPLFGVVPTSIKCLSQLGDRKRNLSGLPRIKEERKKHEILRDTFAKPEKPSQLGWLQQAHPSKGSSRQDLAV
jgi:hypothetical protein